MEATREPLTLNEVAADSRRQGLAGRLLRFTARHPMVIGFSILIGATLVMRLVWGWQVERAVQADYDRLRARGAAVTVDQLNESLVSGARDAITQVARAAKLDSQGSPMNGSQSFPHYPPYGTAWEAAAAQSEADNAAVFDLIRRLRHTTDAEFRTPVSSPLVAVLLPGLHDTRTVANTVGDGARYRHLRGDDAEALERILDLLNLSRLVRQERFVVSGLVGAGISAMACQITEVIAPGLNVGDPKVRELTRAVIDRLLDVQQEASSFVESMDTERLSVDDGMQYLAKDFWVMRPLARNETRVANQRFAAAADAARQPSAPAARALLAEFDKHRPQEKFIAGLFGDDPPELLKIPDYSGWFTLLRFRTDRVFTQHFRDMAERRAAAVSLAVRLYRADQGRWPERLDELAPKYLPAVPADPFHADGRPLGYLLIAKGLPDGSDRPMVFFDEGVDLPGLIDVEPMYGWQTDPLERRPRQEIRQYRDLSWWPVPRRRIDQQMEDERLRREEEERFNQMPGQ